MVRDRFGKPDREGLIHGIVLQAVLPKGRLPPEADVFNASTDVRYVSEADMNLASGESPILMGPVSGWAHPCS